MLLERGDEVRAMVRPVEDASRLRTLPGVEIVQGDLTDAHSLKRAVQGVERVYNVAAKTSTWGLEKKHNAVNIWSVADLITSTMNPAVQSTVLTTQITVYVKQLHEIVTSERTF